MFFNSREYHLHSLRVISGGIIVFCLILTAVFARSASADSFSLTYPHHQQELSISAHPGSVTGGQVILTNETDRSQEFEITAANTSLMHSGYGYSSERNCSRYCIVDIPSHQVLSPHQARKVNFRVKVPRGRSMGQYLPAISATQTSQSGASTTMFIPIELTVGHPTNSYFRVGGVVGTISPRHSTTWVELINRGNTFATAQGRVSCGSSSYRLTSANLIPGERMLAKLHSGLPPKLRCHATVIYNGVNIASWKGLPTITKSKPVHRAQLARSVDRVIVIPYQLPTRFAEALLILILTILVMTLITVARLITWTLCTSISPLCAVWSRR